MLVGNGNKQLWFSLLFCIVGAWEAKDGLSFVSTGIVVNGPLETFVIQASYFLTLFLAAAAAILSWIGGSVSLSLWTLGLTWLWVGTRDLYMGVGGFFSPAAAQAVTSAACISYLAFTVIRKYPGTTRAHEAAAPMVAAILVFGPDLASEVFADNRVFQSLFGGFRVFLFYFVAFPCIAAYEWIRGTRWLGKERKTAKQSVAGG